MYSFTTITYSAAAAAATAAAAAAATTTSETTSYQAVITFSYLYTKTGKAPVNFLPNIVNKTPEHS